MPAWEAGATLQARATYNYAEVLQKSVYFYECQQAGPLPDWNRVEWRGDATMNDGVRGGLYDAGDHVKFNLPLSYSASMLGWAIYEYGSGLTAAGQDQHLHNSVEFILSYLMDCWDGNNYVFQVGHGGNDHGWWGPVEVIEKEPSAGNRPVLSTTTGASCVMAQSAAALALGYINMGEAAYLQAAQQLFARAYNQGNPSDRVYKASDAAGYYNSWSGPWDEVLWAAVWLHVATGDPEYLAIAESAVPHLNRQGQSNDIEYKWGQVWDDTHYAGLVMLAKLTGKEEYIDFVNMHLDWWTVGYAGERIQYTPGGMAWLNSWGSLRHSTTTAFIAFVYADWIQDQALKTRYRTFAERQIDYALGDNPRGGSYVVGFGVSAPEHPHHRTAHGSWSDSQQVPPNHSHVLYGALVGGPDSNDQYQDDISDYVSNEVACDYNAGFVGALAKMVDLYGGTPVVGFPAPEPRRDELFIEAKVQGSQQNSVDLKVLTNNRSAWPARLIKNLRWRYYVDLSELFAAGYTIDDFRLDLFYQEFPTEEPRLYAAGSNLYYVELAFVDGTRIYPGGQSEYAGEVQMRIAVPNTAGAWDPSNDPSFQCLNDQMRKAECVLLYDGTTKLWGNLDVTECSSHADCDDSATCNGAERCIDNVCEPGTPVVCDDGIPCTHDTCDEARDVCSFTPNDARCSNGLFCDGAEICDLTSGCVDGVLPCPVDCDEVNDKCIGCTGHGDCDDGAYCNGIETCVQGECQAGTPVICDDAIGCTVDVCDESQSTCVYTPDDAACQNNLFCDGEESCDASQGCAAGTTPCPPGQCDEANDRCFGASCSIHDDCDDTDFCNGQERCEAGTCEPGVGWGQPCYDATPLAANQHSGDIGLAEKWFLVTQSIRGWQASEAQGRTIRFNGVEVAPGQMPLPDRVDGAYYVQFTAGGKPWASWSFWD